MKRWLAAILALVLLLSILPAGSVAAEYATVKGGWLRLRSYPSFDSQTLASYYTGTVVELLGTSGVWYHVRLSDGNTGYMHGDYLTKGAAAPGGGTATGTNATVVSSNGYGVRLRMGPGTNYRVIRKFPVGTPAVILQSGSYWCRISIGGYTGYMMSQFLSTTDPGSSISVDYVGDATIWSSNGYGVRLRTGPGKEYGKIGVYSVGTQVRIITKGDTWDYIQVGSRRGYMMNEFLLYNNHYTVTAVTINNLKPVVGNVLAVQSVSPSTATVTYEWLVKPEEGSETVKGTSAAYMVTDDDIGSTIRLRVTGKGSYKDSASSASTEKVVRTGVVNKVSLSTTTPYVGDVLKAQVSPAGATVDYHWSVDGVEKSTDATYTVQAADAGKAITLRVDGRYPFSGSCSVSTNPVVGMDAPVIDTAALPEGKYQNDYQHQLSAYGGGNHSWSIIRGSLPAGLALGRNGLISGTPIACGTSTFTVQVSNEMGNSTHEFTLTIGKAMVSVAAVEGVAIPAKDETAPAAIQTTDQYTGTIQWQPELTNGTFAASTAYTAIINLTAKPEYTFTGLTSSFFTVSGASGVSCTIGSDGNTATVTAVFPATAATTAVKLAKPVINGITKQDDQWIISWSAVENASGYMLRIGTQLWQSCQSNSYRLSGTPASGTYQVFAVGDGVQYSDSDTSDYVFTMPVAIPLNAPANIRITNTSEDWVISWDAVANANGYKLRKAGGEWKSVAGTSHTLAEAPKSNDQFEVVAVGDGTYYADSTAGVYIYTAPAVKLSAPTGLTIQENGGVWTASWNNVENASGYRFGDTLGNWYACSVNSFTFAGTPACGEYCVYAVGNGITSTDSDTATYAFVTDPLPVPVKLAAPSNLSIVQQDGVWIASWGAVENATGYRFGGSDGDWIACTGTSYTFASEPAEDVYSVYAVGDGIHYVDSDLTRLDFSTAPVPPLTPLPAPVNLTIQEEDGVWSASWDAVENAAGYRFRKNDGAWVDCAFGSYTFINPPQTATYSVMATGDQASFADSGVTAISFVATVILPEQLPAPAALTIREENGVWIASWDAVENAIGYYFRKKGDEWRACDSNSYTFTQPPVSADYTVYAVADGITYRDSSITSIAYTAPAQMLVRLTAPAELTIAEENGVWVARWNSVENASGYRFRQNEDNWLDCDENCYTFVEPPVTASYTILAVGDGTAYTDSETSTISYTAPVSEDDAVEPEPVAPTDEETAAEQQGSGEDTGINMETGEAFDNIDVNGDMTGNAEETGEVVGNTDETNGTVGDTGENGEGEEPETVIADTPQ